MTNKGCSINNVNRPWIFELLKSTHDVLMFAMIL